MFDNVVDVNFLIFFDPLHHQRECDEQPRVSSAILAVDDCSQTSDSDSGNEMSYYNYFL